MPDFNMALVAANIVKAKRDAVLLSSDQKRQILHKIADTICEDSDMIIQANSIDINEATQNGISQIMIDRLMMNQSRIENTAQEARRVASLPDPVGKVLSGHTMSNGLTIFKESVPIGAIGIIYESRPNVTVDAATLCIMSSNVVLLRGGKEAINTNIALMRSMRKAIDLCGANPDIVQLVEDTSHETAKEMMQLNGVLDLLIPRGGAALINSVVKTATVPVIETGVGNCHIYVDEFADLNMATSIVYNAKTSRPAVCNACETLLVHERIANVFLPMVKAELDKKSVILLGCEKTLNILESNIAPATEDDYKTEFLDYVLAVKIVSSMDEAIDHIAKYSTGHSEAIISESVKNSRIFTRRVDSAAVYVNASTRFTDGGQFGLGSEIGISTQKIHARGPMGIDELTSYKYIICGDGQIR